MDSRFMLAEFSYQRHMKLTSIQVQKLPSSAMYSTSRFVIGLCPEKWVNNKPQADSRYKDKTIMRLSSFHNANVEETSAGLILGLHPANGRSRYFVKIFLSHSAPTGAWNSSLGHPNMAEASLGKNFPKMISSLLCVLSGWYLQGLVIWCISLSRPQIFW